jgi:hypothetical protein
MAKCLSRAFDSSRRYKLTSITPKCVRRKSGVASRQAVPRRARDDARGTPIEETIPPHPRNQPQGPQELSQSSRGRAAAKAASVQPVSRREIRQVGGARPHAKWTSCATLGSMSNSRDRRGAARGNFSAESEESRW